MSYSKTLRSISTLRSQASNGEMFSSIEEKMNKKTNLDKVTNFINSLTDTEYFDVFPPLIVEKQIDKNIYSITTNEGYEEPGIINWIKSLRANNQILIGFHAPPDCDKQTYCIDGVYRPISEYELENGLSAQYMEECMCFLIIVLERIFITPGLVSGYDGRADQFETNNLHIDILRTFSAITKDYFSFEFISKLDNLL